MRNFLLVRMAVADFSEAQPSFFMFAFSYFFPVMMVVVELLWWW